MTDHDKALLTHVFPGVRLYFTTRHQTKYTVSAGIISSPIQISKVRVLPSTPGQPELKVEQAQYAEVGSSRGHGWQQWQQWQ